MREQERSCPYCGRDMIFDDNVCPYCGKEIRKGPFSKNWFWVVLVLLILLPMITFLSMADPIEILVPDFGELDLADTFDGILSMGQSEEIAALREEYPELTRKQAEAMEDALWLTENRGIGPQSLLDSLDLYGHRKKDAQAVLDALNASGLDWDHQAELCAEDLLEYCCISRNTMIEQLQSYDGFSYEQAEAAVDGLEVDWLAYSLEAARQYLENDPYSKTGLAERMEYNGFTAREIQHAQENCQADWMENAVAMGESYLDLEDFPEEQLYDQLIFEGFTEEETLYALEQLHVEP